MRAVLGAFGREWVAAAGTLGGEPGAALGAVLVVGGGLGLAGGAFLDELTEGVEAMAEALFEQAGLHLVAAAFFGRAIGFHGSISPLLTPSLL
jgi:hypothetical protein